MAARKKATEVRCLSKAPAAVVYKLEFPALELETDEECALVEPLVYPENHAGCVAWLEGALPLSREDAIRLRDLLNNIIEVTE